MLWKLTKILDRQTGRQIDRQANRKMQKYWGYFQQYLQQYLQQYASNEKSIEWLNEVDTFTQGLMDWRKIKRTAYQNLDDLQNLLLIKLTVKSRTEKTWKLHDFSFTLNPCDKPNDTKIWKSYSSLQKASSSPANIRLDEDVLKTSFVFVFRRRLQDVFKTSCLRPIYSSWPCLQDVFKTFSRRSIKLICSS